MPPTPSEDWRLGLARLLNELAELVKIGRSALAAEVARKEVQDKRFRGNAS